MILCIIGGMMIGGGLKGLLSQVGPSKRRAPIEHTPVRS